MSDTGPQPPAGDAPPGADEPELSGWEQLQPTEGASEEVRSAPAPDQEPEVHEPEVREPEVAEGGVAEGGVAEGGVAEAGVAEAGVVEPRDAEAETVGSAAFEPEGDEPAAPEVEAGQPAVEAPTQQPDAVAAPRPIAPASAPQPQPAAAAPRRRIAWWPLVRRTALYALLFLLVGPIIGVALYRFIPPPITILMLQRVAQGQGIDHRWVPISRMSPALVRAAIGAEDANFCEHHGFDFAAIGKAMKHDERRPGKVRGGSTISQQTAKNVFLWPDRSWVRKGYEAYITVLIEALWGKQRIMEVYLNTVEMGPGIYGVEAAAQRDFQVSAAQVTPLQAARIIAVLPSPLKWQPVDPSAYVRKRSGKIDAREGQVRRIGSADCVL
jgi:monofunctional glycosyltransferase